MTEELLQRNFTVPEERRGLPVIEVERDAVAELRALAAAVEPVMSSVNYLMGPGARTATSQDDIAKYYRLSLALRRSRGEPCPRCDDTGIDRLYSTYGPARCALTPDPIHRIPVPPVVEEAERLRREKHEAERAAAMDDPELPMPVDS